ncbi:MAG: hypothetical protein N3D10_02170 [Candidatus Micrarchaeota archaeon]|nr:hypothetical protein [Candidatus Micrarchaeota archaeon]
MLLTTSKNLKKEYKKIAKKLSKYIFGLKFSSRKNRSLVKLSALTLKKSHDSIGVFSYFSKKNCFIIRKYFYNPALDIFQWDKQALLIDNLKFGQKVAFSSPIKVQSSGKKNLVKFFSIYSDPLEKIGLANIFKTQILKNNIAKFFYNGQEILSFSFKFIRE